jgi:hypothetical protein
VKHSTVFDAGFAEPSLPRANGAPNFEEPWQARAMAIAIIVVERTGRTWADFRRELIDAIASDLRRPYWDSWVAALSHFVAMTVLD